VVRARITLVFPDNDVTRARAQVSLLSLVSLPDGARHEAAFPGPAMATVLVEEGVEPLIDALRSVGGTASAASLTTTVACPIVPTEDPIALPRAHARDEPQCPAEKTVRSSGGSVSVCAAFCTWTVAHRPA
jgi:hypothetical protein